ncbi:MAG: DUF2306 domain-containing protein [Bacteroidota bacterium]
MKKKAILFLVFALLCVLISAYPILYYLSPGKFALMNTKSDTLLANLWWQIGFYTHITFGGIALLIGWTQFWAPWRLKYLVWHRLLGKLYVISVLLSATAGFGIGLFATGGWVSAAGFVSLAIFWFATSWNAYLAIRQGDVDRHQRMMLYSFAATFAAVSLRLWMPLLIAGFGSFLPAYRVVAWLSWVPNVLLAHFYLLPRLKARALHLQAPTDEENRSAQR